VERTHHGDTFVDDYDWLRDKDAADTRAYLEAENAYTEAMTEHLESLRGAIFDEIKAHTQETDLTVPSRYRGHWYYQRTIEGRQYAVVCRTKAVDDDWTPPALEPGVDVPGEEVLVDCNALADGQEFFRLGAFAVSLDEQLLAYSTDLVGDERYTIVVKDLRTGELLPDTIANTMGGVIWSSDGTHLFYATVNKAWRPDKIWRHRLGAPTDTDTLVHHEADDRFWTGISRTTSDRFLVIVSHSMITSECRILDSADPTGDFTVLVPREDGVEYTVEHGVVGSDDVLLVVHNKDAPNFTLGVGPIGLHSLGALSPLIAPSDEVRVADVQASAGAVVVNLRQGGLPEVRVFPLTERGLGKGHNLRWDEPMYSVHASGFSDWDQPLVRLSYQSWLTPSTVYELDPATGKRHLRKQQPVLGGYDPAAYVQVREWATAGDGVQIPVSIIRRRDVEPRSNAPALLYGYGSYEISMDPEMRIPWLSLLDRGMVVAVAHIRGGGEMGRHWYEDGKQLAKKNTFTDFVDTAQHLVDEGWTSPRRLVAHGGSAGGLLMGAVANMAPELFAGLVAQVPFVDALTTVLDASLPLTVIEWDEWGDPLHDPEVYAYMKSYTPYENIEAGAYPAIYAITSINDTRVLYVEPAKWVAQLRATAITDRPILLKCEMSAGHGGASGRYDAWRQRADYLAWMVDVVGASPEVLP
jgi:oligopeptidase B